MSNLSISLTFSDDGEYLQLSRMDAAILLTWIMGGDHDNEPEVQVAPAPKPEPTPASAPVAPKSAPVAMTKAEATPQESSLPTKPVAEAPVAPKAATSLPKSPPKQAQPPAAKKAAAAKIVAEKEVVEVPDLPFAVTPKSLEYVAPVGAPSPGELIEEEPYWEYGDAPEPKR